MGVRTVASGVRRVGDGPRLDEHLAPGRCLLEPVEHAVVDHAAEQLDRAGVVAEQLVERGAEPGARPRRSDL